MNFLNLAIDGCPAAFVVAMTQSRDGEADVAGAGRGLSQDEAIAGCIAETVERAAAERAEGLEVIEAHAVELPRVHCLPNEIWCLSDRQLAHGMHDTEDVSAATWRATLQVHAEPRRWCPGRTAGGVAPVQIPLANALIGGEGTITDSNGVAAGRSLAEAETSALLELIERDAVAVWWYGRIRRPPVAIELLDASGGAAVRAWLQTRERHTWLLDLTHDLRTPVVAAVSCGPDGRDVAYGFAARLARSDAALSACLEMLQTELSLNLARSAAAQGLLEGHGARLLDWSRRTAVAETAFLAPHSDAVAAPAAPSDPIAAVAERIGREVAFIDLHRPGDSLFVVRAIAPGLRPWWPRFRPGRLEAVPHRLGWQAQPIDEAAIGDDVILI